jgi:hypothetical protein
MKTINLILLLFCFIIFAGYTSCKRDPVSANNSGSTGSNNANKPPIAVAGNDTTITLPANTINLDGSKSTDPDNNITTYTWTKIEGPSSFSIANASGVQTQANNLAEGVYLFELKVTDAGGLFDRDTIRITVNQQPSPPPCTTNCDKIVFVSKRDGNDEIYSCNADGSNVTRLTNNAAVDEYPAWSPDGTKIAFTRNDGLYIMNADGSNIVQKTFSTNLIARHPSWSPDGSKIVFEYLDNLTMESKLWVVSVTNSGPPTYIIFFK